jgi:small-conductance mechanosensitive channel
LNDLAMIPQQILLDLGVVLAAAAAGLLAKTAIFYLVSRVGKRTTTVFDDSFARHCAAPSRYTLPILAVSLALPGLDLPEDIAATVARAATVLLILGVAWFLMRFSQVLADVLMSRFDVEQADNLRARRVVTQVDILRKIVVVIIGILAVAAVLTRFERLADLGAGILASAGLAGLVLGFAAQRTLANLLAGLQIAFTQPIRIDDVVIVEGEWGRIEEITLTFVVVRIWDLRRLVVPIGYFLEKPFQNWTRVSADLLGSVYLYVDYHVDCGAVRGRLHELLEDSEHWDGKVCRLHVTDAKEDRVELRALMSAPDAGAAWELRCEVRERLLQWLRDTYPESLPRQRVELESPGGDSVPHPLARAAVVEEGARVE